MDILFNVKDGELENSTSFEIACAAVKVLDSKKAGDIKLLKIDKKTIIADYFVICTGNSSTQIKTLADEVEYQLGVGKVPYVRLEGTDSDEWKIIDCHDIIVHVFSNEARGFYKLEKLWADAEEIDINSIIG
ncbi:MAG: ribosome silencing factor [Ruminococcaceae bacterium]|nr:ribosome silencing factor [Oscillospiraceae bacterium]